MPPTAGEQITSTSDGDIIGGRSRSSRWAPQNRSTIPRAAEPPAPVQSNGDILGRRWAQQQPSPQPREPITSTIDERDIIGRRWVPTIDRFPSSRTPPGGLQSRHAPTSTSTLGQQQNYHDRPTTASASVTPTPTTINTSAPGTANPAAASRPTTTSKAVDLDKIKRLIDRLSWKSNVLRFSQHVALASPDAPSAAAQPTTMFKLDFFEYYTLLERILVLLLQLFRVPIAKSPINNSSRNGGWAHSYHENVLAALASGNGGSGGGERGDEGVVGRDNPLKEVLGTGPAMEVLRSAKNFRNRWKDADEQAVPTWECQREDILELQLDRQLEVVLAALESAYRLAELRVKGNSNSSSNDSLVPVVEYLDEDMEDAPWEAVGDAMEDAMEMDVE